MGYGSLHNDYEQCRLYCSRSVHSYFNIEQLDCGRLRRITRRCKEAVAPICPFWEGSFEHIATPRLQQHER
jgi:hypothetical protein